MDSASIIKDRRILHKIPEIGMELPRTADYCEQALRGMGLMPRRIGDGLIVDLGSAGPLFAWRADMDALPIQEETGADFASTIPGRMHACGHDAHMAIALGIARHYSTEGAPLPCRLRLIFQPGEEGYGGALRMIRAEALEGVEAIAGLHVGCFSAELAKGCFGTRKGTLMGSVDAFEVTFKGTGTHGAYPNRGADPLLAACQFVAGLQTVRYRAVSPVRPASLSIGSIQAGTVFAVIPELAVVKGGTRATTGEDQAALLAGVRSLAEGIAMANGIGVRFEHVPIAPMTANTDPALPDLLAASVAEVLGADSFRWLADPIIGGEDFGEFLLRVPGVFFFLATNPDGCEAQHHHPGFSVADEVLPGAVLVVDALIRNWAAAQR